MVFVLDLADLDADDVDRVIRRGEDVIRRMPKKSVLALTNLSNNGTTDKLKEYAKQFLEQSKPQVLKGAFSGISDGRLKADWDDLLSSVGNDLETFASFDDALSWLIESDAA
jgi:hypothetical protein